MQRPHPTACASGGPDPRRRIGRKLAEHGSRRWRWRGCDRQGEPVCGRNALADPCRPPPRAARRIGGGSDSGARSAILAGGGGAGAETRARVQVLRARDSPAPGGTDGRRQQVECVADRPARRHQILGHATNPFPHRDVESEHVSKFRHTCVERPEFAAIPTAPTRSRQFRMSASTCRPCSRSRRSMSSGLVEANRRKSGGIAISTGIGRSFRSA